MARIEFAALKRRVSIEQVCDWLGLKLKKKGAQLRGQCPICSHESERCFVVTTAKGLFWCFGHCKSGGDCIELTARVKQISQKEAASRIAADFNSS